MQRRWILGTLATPWWWSVDVHAVEQPYHRSVLVDQDDVRTSLAMAAGGQTLVVVVMKGHWCRVCIAQLERLCELEQQLTALDARLVGLNADAPALNRRMRDENAIDCPVLSDESHEVLSALGLWLPRSQHPLPALLVFDRCGDEAARWVGRSPADRPERALIRIVRKLAEEKRVCERPSA